MYVVRCSVKNRFGAPFHWDFSVDTDDHAVAVSEAVTVFWSGFTFEEREDAAGAFEVIAHPYRLPDAPLPVQNKDTESQGSRA
jgi:hypothetical protein